MNDIIEVRRTLLDELVGLKCRYVELCDLQQGRLGGIDVNNVPQQEDIIVEGAVFAEEAAIISRFAESAARFPAPPPPQPVFHDRQSNVSRWSLLGRRSVTITDADPVADPASRELALQQARFAHILTAFLAVIADRKLVLQHASFQVKKSVVELNQSGLFLLSDAAGCKAIERERHRLEGLVSSMDKVQTDLVVSSRSISILADEAEKLAAKPEPEKTVEEDEDDGYYAEATALALVDD